MARIRFKFKFILILAVRMFRAILDLKRKEIIEMDEEDYSSELLIFFILLAAIPLFISIVVILFSLTVVKQKEVMIVERW